MANRQDIRSRLSIICCVFGIILVLVAIVLVTLSFVKPLWTPWGRAEYSRNVHNAFDSLFETEEEALKEMGQPESCTSKIENRTIPTENAKEENAKEENAKEENAKEETHAVKRWVCPGTAKINTTGTVTRRKRNLSDNDRSCATLLYQSSPITIPGGYRGYQVVQLSWVYPQRYQFVQQATCGSNGLCDGTGSCLLHTRVQRFLVSNDVISSWWAFVNAVIHNKVWFENYVFPACCKCAGYSRG